MITATPLSDSIVRLRRLQEANGSIRKTQLLREFQDDANFRNFLYYALNPMLTYKISEQMYPHARSRFKEVGLPLPYGDNGFAPSKVQLSKGDDMLRQAKQFWEELNNGKTLRIESCAEPGLTEPIACGCISDYDLNLLGLSEDAKSSDVGYQRKSCMCYAGKTELLKHKTRCPHGCLYCYWRG